MPTQIDPNAFNWIGQFQAGQQQAQENQRRNALFDLGQQRENRLADLQSQQADHQNQIFQQGQEDRTREQGNRQKQLLLSAASNLHAVASDPMAFEAVKGQILNDPELSQLLSGMGVDASHITPEAVNGLMAQARIGAGAMPPEQKAPGQLYQIGPEGRYGTADQAIGQPAYRAPQQASQGVTSVLGPDGQPIYVRTSDAVGRTPASGNVGAIDLSPGGLELAGETYRTTGNLPKGVSRDPKAVGLIINAAADSAARVGDDAKATLLRQQAFKANQVGLSALTKQQQMVGAFEKTAIKNLDLAVSLGSKVDRSGSPLLNKGILAFKQGIRGDPETAQFVNALIAARTEYAKVLSGATGAQGITDSARHEADDLFNKASSQQALEAVIATAKQEMANRMVSFDEQKKELNSSFADKSAAGKTINFSDLPP